MLHLFSQSLETIHWDASFVIEHLNPEIPISAIQTHLVDSWLWLRLIIMVVQDSSRRVHWHADLKLVLVVVLNQSFVSLIELLNFLISFCPCFVFSFCRLCSWCFYWLTQNLFTLNFQKGCHLTNHLPNWAYRILTFCESEVS